MRFTKLLLHSVCLFLGLLIQSEISDGFTQRLLRSGCKNHLKVSNHNKSSLLHNHQRLHCFERRSKLCMSLEDQKDKTPPLTKFLEKFSNTGIDNRSIQLNSLVVAKYDLPKIGIYADQTYELKSIYFQGVNEENGEVERISLTELDLTGMTPPYGYELYIKLYSPMYHEIDNPVVVTPSEVGLISMKDEVLDSILVAIPILSFWLGTCYIFASKYNERYGGNFVDAFFGK